MLNRNLLYTVCSLCNKNLIVRALTCFLIFIGFVDAHTFTITGETAQKIVIDNIISDNIGKVDVYFLRNSAQKYVCDKEKRLQLFHGKEIDFPYENNWVFFVDDYPPMNWFHPCRYIFIDPQTGNYKIVQHEVYPENLREDYDLVVEMPRPNNNLLQKASKSAEIQTVTTAVSNPNLYAVIISGTDEDQYWRDISAIYCTLNQVYGFTKDNIFVHYAEGRANLGHDLDDPEDPSYDFDYSAYKGNIERTFKNLTGEWTNDTNVPALDINDHLYVFVTDHGGLGQGGHTYIVLPNDVDLYDYELAEYVDALNCAQITFVMQQCFSGGFIDDLTDYDTYDVKCKHRTIHTACDYDEYSICEMHISDWKYDEFIFYWTAAARGYYPVIDEPWNVDQDAPVGSFSFNSISTLISHPSDYDPDLNSDGKIQMEEAFDYANNFDTWSEYGYYCPYPTPPYCYYTESPQDVNNIGFEEDLLCLEGISGTIENSQCVEGNFLICDDLEIDNNTALDIHDSTTFHFVDGASLTVNGSMNVIGTSSSLIVFTSANASPSIGDWEGIRFLESVYEECQIQYATFEYADTAISIKDCSPNINNSQINNCVYGIKVTGSNADPTISYMDIEDNSRGVFFGKNASGILSYSSVIDNTYGIQIDNS